MPIEGESRIPENERKRDRNLFTARYILKGGIVIIGDPDDRDETHSDIALTHGAEVGQSGKPIVDYAGRIWYWREKYRINSEASSCECKLDIFEGEAAVLKILIKHFGKEFVEIPHYLRDQFEN